MPLHRKYWPRCGARTRQGRPCRMAVVELGKRRCKFHGGLSTGPKTAGPRADSGDGKNFAEVRAHDARAYWSENPR